MRWMPTLIFTFRLTAAAAGRRCRCYFSVAALCQLINDAVAWTRMLSASAAQIVRINNNCGGTCGRRYVTAAVNMARNEQVQRVLCYAKRLTRLSSTIGALSLKAVWNVRLSHRYQTVADTHSAHNPKLERKWIIAFPLIVACCIVRSMALCARI